MAQVKTSTETGLTQEQVQTRFDNGQHNLPLKPLTRSVSQIIQQIHLRSSTSSIWHWAHSLSPRAATRTCSS